MGAIDCRRDGGSVPWQYVFEDEEEEDGRAAMGAMDCRRDGGSVAWQYVFEDEEEEDGREDAPLVEEKEGTDEDWEVEMERRRTKRKARPQKLRCVPALCALPASSDAGSPSWSDVPKGRRSGNRAKRGHPVAVPAETAAPAAEEATPSTSASGRTKGRKACHQCKAAMKQQMPKCKRCRDKIYCGRCIKDMYPELSLGQVRVQCPSCRGICKCKRCNPKEQGKPKSSVLRKRNGSRSVTKRKKANTSGVKSTRFRNEVAQTEANDNSFLSSNDNSFLSPMGEQVRMPTKKKSTKGASTKGKNWSSAEDLVLIQACASTSLDVVTGADQNLSTYWGRISDYYNSHKKPSWPERVPNGLTCRYNTISALTSRFCACVQQILNRNGSGLTLSDKERDAHRLFIELDEKKKPFTLMHCYIEFEKYPKWQTRPPPQKKHKKTSDASSGTTSNDEDFDVCTDTLEEEIRPPGTKKDKKERLLKDSACKLSLESVWAQKIEKDDAKEAAKNARYARAFELQEKQIALQEREDARKQFELEEKIMLMDTSGMSDAQKQFYKKKQDEIAARCQNTTG